MEAMKQKLNALLTAAGRVVRSRLFAAGALCMAAVMLAVGISVNSRAVTINDGDTSRVVLTMHNDPYKVLASAGVVLEEHDTVEHNPATEHLDVRRAMQVQVQADGLTTLLYMTDGTAADALQRAEVTVGTHDTVSVALDTPVAEGLCINVDRVAYREYTVTESIDYTSTTRYSAMLKPGTSKVQTYGKEGEKTITFRDIIVNGQVTETVRVGEKVTRQPVDKVILKGTTLGTPLSKAPYDIALDEGGQPLHYKKVLSGTCTAYTADRGDSGSWTSTGQHVRVGLVAVNPKVIPYGTKMWITSADGSVVYGYAIAGDTGGALMSNRVLVDLYMDTLVECNSFGRRGMKVYILE